jgi:hypothetical protein
MKYDAAKLDDSQKRCGYWALHSVLVEARVSSQIMRRSNNTTKSKTAGASSANDDRRVHVALLDAYDQRSWADRVHERQQPVIQPHQTLHLEQLLPGGRPLARCLAALTAVACPPRRRHRAERVIVLRARNETQLTCCWQTTLQNRFHQHGGNGVVCLSSTQGAVSAAYFLATFFAAGFLPLFAFVAAADAFTPFLAFARRVIFA